MAGFVDFLRMFGLWSSAPSTVPDPTEGITLRLRCDNTLTMNLHCDNDLTLRLPTTNSLTFQLRVT